MAAEAAGRNVTVMKADEDRSVSSFAKSSYEEAIGDAMLRAAQQGMNYLALDAVDKTSGAMVVSGRGFVCPVAAAPDADE